MEPVAEALLAGQDRLQKNMTVLNTTQGAMFQVLQDMQRQLQEIAGISPKATHSGMGRQMTLMEPQEDEEDEEEESRRLASQGRARNPSITSINGGFLPLPPISPHRRPSVGSLMLPVNVAQPASPPKNMMIMAMKSRGNGQEEDEDEADAVDNGGMHSARSDDPRGGPSRNGTLPAPAAPNMPRGWPGKLEMRPTLKRWQRDSNTGSLKRADWQTNTQTEEDTKMEEEKKIRLRWLREPDTTGRQVWEIIGFVFTLYDLLVIPYSLAWDVPHVGFVADMDWLLVSFWSVDMCLAFITGYHQDGEIVMPLRKTSRRYLRSWFPADAAMVLSDWIVLTILTSGHHQEQSEDGQTSSNHTTDAGGGASVRLLRFAKLAKLVRVIDVLRVLKILRTFEAFLEHHLSQSVRLLLRMAYISGGILYLNHTVACAWYALGKSGETDTGGHWQDTTLDIHGEILLFAEATQLYQYATSLHWAVSQLTLSSMEVGPRNSAERALSCVTLFVGLMFGCFLTSMLSSIMVEMRLLKQGKAEQLSSLRRFLLENQALVSPKLSLFVQRQVTERLREGSRLAEKEVSALHILSSSARRDLHAEITIPQLIRHPLFRLWRCIDRTWFVKFCEAAEIILPRAGDDIFATGAVASGAYYVIAGSVTYTQEPDTFPVEKISHRTVEQGRWLAEAALWTDWFHVGKGEALVHCQILFIKSSGLFHAARTHRMIRAIASEYGKAFHERVTTAVPPFTQKWPDDLEVPFAEYEEVVETLATDIQVTIGTIAVENWKPKGLFQGNHKKTADELLKEVHNGKSLAILSGTGEVIRVVAVVIVELARDDGNILVQLGKWEGEGKEAAPDCTLPAVKRERDELTDQAASRLLKTKLAPLADFTKVEKRRTEVVVQDSAGFGVRTKYLRKIVSARLTEPIALPECETMHFMKESFVGRCKAGTLEALEKLSLTSLLFCKVPGKDKGLFCAWLPRDDFERLRGFAGEAPVKAWLADLRPPSDTRVLPVPRSVAPGVIHQDTTATMAPLAVQDFDSGNLVQDSV